MKRKINLEELFESYFEPFCKLIEKEVGDIDNASDIVTEAFWYLHREVDGMENASMEKLLRLLLKKIFEGCALFLQEKENKQQALEDINSSVNNEQSVEDIMIVKELHNLVEQVHSRLSKQQKRAIDIFFSEDDPKKTAEIMNISDSTFRSHKSEAIKKFRIALQNAGWVFIVILLEMACLIFYINR